MPPLSLWVATAIASTHALSLRPFPSLNSPNLTTNTTQPLTNWPRAPFSYHFHGLTIDISAYARHTPTLPVNPILLDLVAIQNQIYASGRPSDRFEAPTELSSGAVKLFFYPHGMGWVTRRQAALVADALWELTFAFGVRGIMWAGVRVGEAGEGGGGVSAVKVDFVVEILGPGGVE